MSASQPQAVRVCCRVRPALPSESTRCCTEITSFNGMRMIQLNDPRNTRESITYQFDEVYTAASTQEDIHRREGILAAERIMSGFPASFLAYGTAGSGKTHTLYGQRENPGLGPQCVAAILKMVREAQLVDESRPILQVSYCELYHNQVFDLLAGKGHEVTVGSDGNLTGSSQSLTKKDINNIDELWDIIQRLREERMEQRKEAPVGADRASRSHTIMSVYATHLCGQGSSADPGGSSTGARLTLVDLAGNDDSRKGGASHQSRLIEPASIQHSLMSLGRVVAALHLKSGPAPVEESKLTQLLGEAFVQGSLTTLITCIAPHPKYYHDTSSSLDFAAHARGQPEGTAVARSRKHVEPPARGQRPASSNCLEPLKRGGASRSSFAAMMAPPPMLHPALCGQLQQMGGMREVPPRHWMDGLHHQQEAYQQHMSEAAAAAAAAAGMLVSAQMVHMGQPAPAVYSGGSLQEKGGIIAPGTTAAASKKRKTADGSNGSGDAVASFRSKEPPVKSAKHATQPVPAWGSIGVEAEACADEASSGQHLVDVLMPGYEKAAGKGPQELSMADTPCRKEVSTPLRSNAPDMPGSLLKGSGHKTLASDMSLWGPMTPIASSNVEFSHMSSSSYVSDNNLRDLLGCTPRSGGDMLLDFDGASGDVGASSSHKSARGRGGIVPVSGRRSSARRRASTELVALDESAAINTSDLLLTPLRDLDVDLRFNSRSPTSGHANSPYLLLPDTPADHLYALAGVMPAGHKASPTCLIGTSQRTCNVRSSPGGMERRPEMPGFAVACPSLEAAPPPPLHEALAMTGGVDGKAHRKLLDILNHANISKLCCLKGIGKQRARKLVETRQLHPYGPVFTHIDQLASVAGMTSRQIDKFFVDNLEIPLPR